MNQWHRFSTGEDKMPEETPQSKTRESVISALKTIFDPEIPVNIYELGLIYKLDVDDAGKADIRMTLTSPACPVAGSLVAQVEQKAKSVNGVTDAKVDLVWDPPWTPARMSDAAKLQLNMDLDDDTPPKSKKFFDVGRLD